MLNHSTFKPLFLVINIAPFWCKASYLWCGNWTGFWERIERDCELRNSLFYMEMNPYYWRKFWERLDDQVALKETVDQIVNLFNEYNEAYLYLKCVASA